MKSSGPGVFCRGMLLNPISLTVKEQLRVSISSNVILSHFIFRELAHFIQDIKLFNLFIIFTYYPSYICRICSDVLIFIPGVSNLNFHFFPS